MLDCMCAGGMHLAALMAGTWSASMAHPGSLYGARAWRTAPILAMALTGDLQVCALGNAYAELPVAVIPALSSSLILGHIMETAMKQRQRCGMWMGHEEEAF